LKPRISRQGAKGTPRLAEIFLIGDTLRGQKTRLLKPGIRLLCAFALVACGSRTDLGELELSPSEEPSLCASQTRCGGEPFGRWRAVEACTSLEFISNVHPCQELEFLEQTPELDGFKSYTRDGRYSSALTYSGSVELSVPASCLAAPASASACTALAEGILHRGQLFLSDAVCAEASDGCRCEVLLTAFDRETSGTFTAEDGFITEDRARPAAYCVEADTLWLIAAPGRHVVFVREGEG